MLRGRTELGSTILTVLERYAQNLRDADCRLMLTGVSEHILDDVRDNRHHQNIWPERTFSRATDRAGESMLEALSAAEEWLEDTVAPAAELEETAPAAEDGQGVAENVSLEPVAEERDTAGEDPAADEGRETK